MPAVKRNRPMELMWRFHVWAFERSGGRVGSRIMGMPVLRLTTTGRKSGEPRSVTLMYLDDGGTPVVIASNAGEPRHPSWYLNLREHPEARVMTRAGERRVRARTAEGEERARLWRRLLEQNGDYGTYAERAGGREIPLVILEPA